MQLPDLVKELATWARYQAIDCQLAGNENYATKFSQIEGVLQLIPAMLDLEQKQDDLLNMYRAEVERLQTLQRY